MRFFIAILLLVTAGSASAQVRNVSAVKISRPIKLDGNLNDAAWDDVPLVNNFITASPDFGKPASKNTVVKIAYDDAAVYVGAYMYDERVNIRKQLSQRDVVERQDVDVFSVGLDTYHDRQNAFSFEVSAAGVQADARQSITAEDGIDRSWDAVWQSVVSIKQDGWVAELRIPFSAIRFAKKNVQDWGLQFKRFSRKINETATWSAENPNVDGKVNQWGDWTGLTNISPPLRLSFLPYLSGGVRNSPANNGTVTEYLKSGGMDVKYGINESFTLDMTLIPDFAQVQSDNVFLNLSPFQIKFDDFRPFFTEGTELFNKAGLFYSRRIGAIPGGNEDVLAFVSSHPEYTINKNPGITRLYNATKLSGRTKNNLGIGVLNAVGAPMYARLHNISNGKDSSFLTEALTNYNIVVLDKALKNRSSVTFTNSNVLRRGNARNANVSAVNISLFDKKNVYNVNGFAKYSYVWGSSQSVGGYTANAELAKVSGKIQWDVSATAESDTYDPNDLGFLQNNNSFLYRARLRYIINKPAKHFLSQRYSLYSANTYLYKPFKWADFVIGGSAFGLFKNFWDARIEFEARPLYFNDFFETRTPGIFLKRIPYTYIGTEGSSDSRKKLYLSWNFGFAESPFPNDMYSNIGGGLRYRFNDKFQLSFSASAERDRGKWAYSFRDSVNSNGGLYNDPVLAFSDVPTTNSVINAQYSFTPRMNWSLRLRHNWTRVENKNFYKVKPNGYWYEIPFAEGKDKNFNAFNVDMFYTWDFKWGSRITIGWKNALGSNVYLNPYENNTYGKNIQGIFTNPHSNEVTVKIVYYVDYLDLKKQTR